MLGSLISRWELRLSPESMVDWFDTFLCSVEEGSKFRAPPSLENSFSSGASRNVSTFTVFGLGDACGGIALLFSAGRSPPPVPLEVGEATMMGH